jgi:hypothetical protein
MITVEQTDAADPFVFRVTVEEGPTRTRHQVTMGHGLYQKLTGGRVPPARCIELAFVYLLERERKEAILPNFDVTMISAYFPGFTSEFKSIVRGAG